MHHFAYKGGVLHAEDVSLDALASEVGTPFYCYSTATLERHYRVFAEAFADADALVCYSIKANSNIAVLRTLGALGSGMDVVSEGELRRAQTAGVPSERIVFSGVGKTREEMAFALKAGIYAFNVESEPELSALSEVATGLGATARVAVRVNPDIDPKTHRKISTGKAEDKFGVPYTRARELYAEAAALRGIQPCGIHMHIGSQITDLKPFGDAFALLKDLAEQLADDGISMEFVNFGGGLGVPYRGTNDVPPHPDEYARVVFDAAKDLGCKLLFEPGRMIAANAGILVSRVLYVKQGADKTFTVVDAAMNDLIRPTLYEAYHDIWPVAETLRESERTATDVVGPVCETGDYLALDRQLPSFSQGDLVAIMTAGAYGAVQSSTYNTRLLVPEVLVKGSDYEVVRPRPDYDDLIGREKIPNWL
ncbi:MAG: diaminopimelate decarboxylase [Hyphomicrobiaceae bacterium]|nr:diaminopimelate decarboxylase [Hyphomicrobiaceae bacterium]